MKTIFFIPLVCLLCFAQGCKQKTKLPVEVSSDTAVSAIDSRGKEVKLPHAATRVVALYEALVDDIFMLDAQDKLVGIPQQTYLNEDAFAFFSTLDSRMAKKQIATPTFGGGASSIEALIGLQPDLVLTFDQDKEAIAQLEDLGIAVFTIASEDAAGIINELKGIGTLVGQSDRATKITDYIEKEIQVMETIPMDHPKTVYYAWSKGRVLSTSGKGTLMDMAIRLSGAVNACPLAMQAPNIGAEMLYKWNPDLIILWNSNANDVYKLSELANLPAVVNKQVKVMRPSFLYDPHTVKFLLFAKQVRQWSYPAYTAAALERDLEEAMQVLYVKKH
ncbi:ABC transporter substrate-binding protein [Myroides sp. 1354]|uniref:ABC transporter substrate-binding protein n=1 Tax=unclassified Myroides TaxID=2642485 RepID=UPI002578C0E4|nr:MULTISPECIES: ABC transporter substrate-binding protein [unclassified Myroides]MDM1044659.1 ABC transporter substrate-binding protein [Myroides sp. R163-1]MDM1055372.1 ABC transporter substrate-binding protein [Myroides sp. 1354]MDM1068669.1 ABC transporter substrate-binding protein [Myroides sp. 1372]